MNELQAAYDAGMDGEPVATETSPLSGNLKRYVELSKRLRDVEGETDTIKEQMKSLEEPILEEMGLMGMQNAKIDGVCVYQKTDRYVSKKGEVSTQDVCVILEQHGLAHLVAPAYSAQSLKAWILEKQVEGVEIPAAILGVLNIGSTVKLATRKS